MATEAVEEGLEQPAEEEKKETFLDFLKELPILIVVAFGIALLIKTFIVQAFFIPSASMEDTLQIKDRVLVSKLSYRLGDVERGDVVVFVSPLDSPTPEADRGPVGNFIQSLSEGLGLRSSERDFIKRVVGVGGDTVEVKEGSVFVNGEKAEEPFVKDPSAPLGDHAPVKIKTGELFVMGDNRLHSQDSRSFGPIKESSVVGRAFILIWPLNRLDWFPS